MTLSSDLDRYLSHPLVGLDQVVIGPDVLDSVRDIVAALPAHNTIALLTDEDEYTTGSGAYLKPAVTGLLQTLGTVTTVVLPGHVHADEPTVSAATAGCAGADVIVTIGSGTLCDIGKVAAGNRPHVVVQSAASVNGFADDQSVLLINGVKRTAHSGWPSAIVVDSDVLEGAPAVLNRSGLGDMISMFTAPADWYLSSLVDMDRGFSAEAAAHDPPPRHRTPGPGRRRRVLGPGVPGHPGQVRDPVAASRWASRDRPPRPPAWNTS